MKRDPFEALGVEVTATDEQIKAAYRDLAWRLHPDRVATANAAEARLAERRMREVNEAWSAIGTPERRASYESARRAARPGGTPRARRSEVAEDGRDPSGLGDEPDEDLVDVVGDQHFWLFRGLIPLVVIGTLLIIVVVTAFAGGPSSPVDPSVSAGVGDCALGNRLVACDTPHDARVMGIAAADGSCPDGQALRELAQPFCVLDDN